MSAQGRGYTYSFRRILAIVGNGNTARGRNLLDELAERLEYALARYTPKNNEAPQKWQPQAPISIGACGERPGRLATAEDA